MKNTVFNKIKSITALLLLVALLIPSLASCGISSWFTKTEIVDGIENVPEGSGAISVLTDKNGATPTSAYLTWTAVDNAVDYIVQISSDENFTNLVESNVVSSCRYSIATVLNYSTKYFVRIFARSLVEGSSVAICVLKTAFTTASAHNTTAPDYTETRMLFDFEDYTTESFNDLFSMNAGGDNVTAEIVDGAGVNGSKALKLTGEKGTMGWGAMVCSMLPTGKKVWSGTTGIRLHIRAEEGSVSSFSVKVGKRGYQTWAKSFTVKNETGTYITIPYEVMEDKGGGDGIWDLSVMTFLQFTFVGSGTLYIDEISVGSTEEYRYDTTADAGKGIAPGILEGFEAENASDIVADGFKLVNVDGTYTEIVESSDGSGSELRFKLMSQSSYIQVNNSYYGYKKYDYNQADGITFKISLSHIKTGANILVKFGSYLNVYTATYDLAGAKAGEYITVKIPFSALALAEGSSGSLDFNKIDTLQIFIKESQYCYVTIDDIGFYKD